MVLELLRGKVTKCQGKVFVFDEFYRKWSCRRECVKRMLYRATMSSNIKKESKRGPKHFSGNLSGIVTLVRLVRKLIPEDDEFVDRLRERSSGKLFFMDGVYDLEQRCFREETEEDMTDKRIPRPFPGAEFVDPAPDSESPRP